MLIILSVAESRTNRRKYNAFYGRHGQRGLFPRRNRIEKRRDGALNPPEATSFRWNRSTIKIRRTECKTRIVGARKEHNPPPPSLFSPLAMHRTLASPFLPSPKWI